MKAKLLLLVAAVVVASQGKLEAEGITGTWEGALETGEPLWMFLTEVSPDSIVGWVIASPPFYAQDSLLVRKGCRPAADSLYLDVSCLVAPPIGCFLILEGTFTSDQADGRFRGHMGHDPTFSVNWSAARIGTGVEVQTWGRLKRR